MNEKEAKQYVFKFECAENWENLTETPDENIRHCQRCSNNVHLVRNDDDFTERAQKGNCVYALQMRTAGIPARPEVFEHWQPKENRKPEEPEKVRALPLWVRFFQFALSFFAALPLVSFLPFYIQRTITRSQTSGGDVIDYGWKARTLYGYIFDYNYFRPEEYYALYLAVNIVLACVFALVIAFVIVLFIMSRDSRRIRIGNGR